MLIQTDEYLATLTALLRAAFGERLCYVGLQGSYLRGEATENSDIDIMTVLDTLTPEDLKTYRSLIRRLPQPEKACGFICSRQDLANWNPLELCHLLHSTRDHYGVLASLLPAHTREDTVRFVQLSLNNLYHELCHRYIYGGEEKSAARLPGTYKGVFFILQNLYYLQSGCFIPTRKELLARLKEPHREVLARSMALQGDTASNFEEDFRLLFCWCQQALAALQAI